MASSRQIPWPTPYQLERAGFVRCIEHGCTTFIEPQNTLGREATEDDLRRIRCSAHRLQDRRRRLRDRDEGSRMDVNQGRGGARRERRRERVTA